VALHQADHVLHQQVALRLHDGGRVWPHEQDQEVVARVGSPLFVLFVVFGVVKRDFDLRAGG